MKRRILQKLFFSLKGFVDKKFPYLAWAYRFFRAERYEFIEPKNTPMGFKFNGDKAMENGSFEPTETKLFYKILNKVDVCINVGANIGYYVCIAANEGKKVIAFEPLHQNVKYLLRNIKANNWSDQIEVYPIGLGEKVSIAELYGSGTGASLVEGWAGVSNQFKTYIPVSTMDITLQNKFKDDLKVIIIDVEGFEFEVLKGSKNFLKAKNKPIWMIEIQTEAHQPGEIIINPNLLQTFDLFFSEGYEAFTVEDNPQKVTREMLESIKASGKSIFSIHNFLFKDPDLDLKF